MYFPINCKELHYFMIILSLTLISSELSSTWSSGEGNDISDVLNTSGHHNKSLESKSETTVRNGTVLSQLSVPPIGLNIEVAVLNSLV